LHQMKGNRNIFKDTEAGYDTWIDCHDRVLLEGAEHADSQDLQLVKHDTLPTAGAATPRAVTTAAGILATFSPAEPLGRVFGNVIFAIIMMLCLNFITISPVTFGPLSVKGTPVLYSDGGTECGNRFAGTVRRASMVMPGDGHTQDTIRGHNCSDMYNATLAILAECDVHLTKTQMDVQVLRHHKTLVIRMYLMMQDLCWTYRNERSSGAETL